MYGILLNRTFGFMKEVEVVLPLSPFSSPPAAATAPPPPPCSSQAGPQRSVEVREPDTEEEPARDLSSRRASPGIQLQGDQCGAESDGSVPNNYTHESIEVNLYMTFISPSTEAE